MKKLILSFFMLTQVSCAGIVVRDYPGVDEEFKPYVEEFVIASNGMIEIEDVSHVTMGFTDYPEDVDTVGTCILSPFLTEIHISKKWWENNPSQLRRMELIFHELGHCVLMRGHTDAPYTSTGFIAWLERILFELKIIPKKGYLPDGCPASFMHPYTFSEFCIGKHLNYYVEELFDPSKAYVPPAALPWNSDREYSCKKPIIVNDTKVWNKHDDQVLTRAKHVCAVRYKSCLKWFRKKKERTYNAICG